MEEILSMTDPCEINDWGPLIDIKHKLGWKTCLKDLIARIKSCISDKFSVRELKELKRMIKSMGKEINYEEILFNFPGKSLELVKKAWETIWRMKQNQILCKIDINQELKRKNF